MVIRPVLENNAGNCILVKRKTSMVSEYSIKRKQLCSMYIHTLPNNITLIQLTNIIYSTRDLRGWMDFFDGIVPSSRKAFWS